MQRGPSELTTFASVVLGLRARILHGVIALIISCPLRLRHPESQLKRSREGDKGDDLRAISDQSHAAREENNKPYRAKDGGAAGGCTDRCGACVSENKRDDEFVGR